MDKKHDFTAITNSPLYLENPVAAISQYCDKHNIIMTGEFLKQLPHNIVFDMVTYGVEHHLADSGVDEVIHAIYNNKRRGSFVQYDKKIKATRLVHVNEAEEDPDRYISINSKEYKDLKNDID